MDHRKHCHNSLSSSQTLKDMDTMLETLVFNSPASRVSEELQRIFQVWHVQRVGFAGAVPHPEGRGCPHPSAVQRQRTAGRVPTSLG